MSSGEPPVHFVCPITQEVMSDPVMDRDGNSFERSAITAWLASGNGTSPITRSALRVADLIPNRALKDAIDTFRAAAARGAPLGPASAANRAAGTSTARVAAALNAASSSSTASGNLEVAIAVNPNNNKELIATFKPPACASSPSAAPRFRHDIICIIDVSGSMGSAAPVQNAAGVKEETGLTVLQVVGHAVRTVSALLGPDDRLGLVTFGDNAEVACPLVSQNDAGKRAVTRCVDALTPSGRTNMWVGISCALEQFKTRAASGAVSHLLLLTDGAPSNPPPRGHVATLGSAQKRLFGYERPVTLSTFGFGYDGLESAMLEELSRVMSPGAFRYIADGGMIGTTFVDFVASLLGTAASQVTVSIKKNEAPAASQRGGSSDDEDDSAPGYDTTHIGAIQHQSGEHSVVLRNTNSSATTATISYFSAAMPNGQVVEVVPIQPSGSSSIAPSRISDALLRREFVSRVRAVGVGHNRVASQNDIKEFIQRIRPLQQLSPLAAAMLADLESQVLLGLSSDAHYSKWARHYALALANAVETECSANFKDATSKIFNLKVFSVLQQLGEQQFLAIPAPIPEVQLARLAGNPVVGSPTTCRPGGGRSAPQSAPISHSYYNVSGGCVMPYCAVLLSDEHSTRAAGEIRKGDALYGGGVVKCVVQIAKPAMNSSNGSGASAAQELCYFNDGQLAITKYHPIRMPHGDKWEFPGECAAACASSSTTTNTPLLMSCGPSELYTFVLEEGNSYRVGGIDVIAWGHGICDDEVAAHEFFGNRAAVEAALRGVDREGFETAGFVAVAPELVRDAKTLRVCGLLPAAVGPLDL